MPETYLVHKAVNLSAVKKKLQKPLDVLAQERELQFKYDGCCVVVNPFEQTSLSRTGELAHCMGQVERLLQGFPQLEGMVLLGEAWHPTKPFNEISGEFRRYAESDWLWFVIWDCLTQEEFAAGRSTVPYIARKQRYAGVRVDNRIIAAHSKAPGTYGDPQEQCNKLVAMGGYDGVVLKDLLGEFTAGRGTTGETIRVKRVLSYDLRVASRHQGIGEKTGRAVYTIQVEYKGRLLGVGSGIPHDLSRVPTPGQIVEIEAMDYSADGLLREPRFKSIRYDKLEPDA